MTERLQRLVAEVRDDRLLELRIETALVPPLAPDELLLRVEAAPLHPSDLGQMLGMGDVSRAERVGKVLRMPLRVSAAPGRPVPLGNEGAGTVIAAGGAAGEALVGRRVAAFAGGMYADHRVLKVAAVTPLPEGVTARDGAAISVNPLTALAMVEVMRRDGARALVHTAAASSLGMILQRICAADGIPLVNIVRRADQVAALHSAGADIVLNSAEADFHVRLVDALVATDATLAFDAIGGGPIAGTILAAMEAAQQRRAAVPGPYGSPVHKQVYVYGRLDLSPTTISPNTGFAWGVRSFLLPYFLSEIGEAGTQRLVTRVLAELATTFRIDYSDEAPLDALLNPALLARANAKATGAKYLIRPDR